MISTSDQDSIRNIIALNCIAFDSKDWPLLKKIVSDDCIVQYPEPIGVTKGVAAYTERLQTAIGHLDTIHNITTQYIHLTSDTTAEAMSYVHALHYLGERFYFADGKYEDKLVKHSIDGQLVWRIKERRASRTGIPSGDRGLLGFKHE
jgi:ketosteroid isomerase-like protein